MSENTGNKPRKRGQRKNNLDIPQRFLDRLSPSVLETSRLEQNEGASASPETLTLEGLFKRFYTARQAAGAAERTLEDYRKHMRWFRQFLASEYSGLDNFVPNRDVIRAWISHMLTVQKLMPSTINIRLRTVKAMFNWCLNEKIISDSPFQNVELLRVPEEDFQIISKAQERKLFDCCELTTFMGLRDALMMSFLLDTGVRIGECMRIFAEETDLQSRSATVRASSAKNRKARTVYFGQRTRELLAVYMAWHERNAKAPNLFLNEYGEPLDKNWATRCVSAIGKRAKITGVRISPHTFRHTFATRYIKATGDPFSLRRLLGHSSMEMVNRYVNQDATDVREQYEKFMDRGDRNW